MIRTPWLPCFAVAALLWGSTATPAAAQLQRGYSAGKGGSTAATAPSRSTTPPPQPSTPTKGGSSNGAGDPGGASTSTAAQGKGGSGSTAANASSSDASTTNQGGSQGSPGGATRMVTTETTPAATTTPVVAVANLALVGRVRSPDATPLAGITVEARQGSRVVTTQTDRTGTYTLNLPAGQWEVSASDLDYDVHPARKVYQLDTAAGTITRIE